jgi:hypothetical protein
VRQVSHTQPPPRAAQGGGVTPLQHRAQQPYQPFVSSSSSSSCTASDSVYRHLRSGCSRCSALPATRGELRYEVSNQFLMLAATSACLASMPSQHTSAYVGIRQQMLLMLAATSACL